MATAPAWTKTENEIILVYGIYLYPHWPGDTVQKQIIKDQPEGLNPCRFISKNAISQRVLKFRKNIRNKT